MPQTAAAAENNQIHRVTKLKPNWNFKKNAYMKSKNKTKENSSLQMLARIAKF